MTESELIDEFTNFAQGDIESALQVVTGLFVGLNVAYCEMRGSKGDSEKEIFIDGPEGQRKITIHAA